MNFKTSAVAACKVVSLASDTPKKARDSLNKEITVHLSLKHANVLEFLDYMIVEPTASRAPSQEKESATKKRKRDDVQKEEKDEEEKTEAEAEKDVPESNGKPRYHPGYYMLLEIAGGGDLFDSVKRCLPVFVCNIDIATYICDGVDGILSGNAGGRSI